MPKFTQLDPKTVKLGRSRAADEARKPFREALTSADAGRIELERGEKPSTVKRLLAESAREVGVRVRSSWEDGQRALLWKKVGK